MSAKRILIILSKQERKTFLPPYLFDELQSLNADVEYFDADEVNYDEWLNILKDKDPHVIIGAWKLPLLPEGIIQSSSLKYVCYLAGSIRKSIKKEHIEDGLIVSNWGDSISRTISECALLLILSCMRRSHHWALEMHTKGTWKTAQTVTQSLFERKIGLHGFGNISQKLVPLLKPFDVSISAFSPSVPNETYEKYGVKRTNTLEELFSENDIIVELAALTEKTRAMVTEKHLRSIPKGGSFVNVGRGAVVDEEALIKVAKEGELQIALDVYAQEPLAADSPLRGIPNVVMLPHLAGPTIDRRQDSGRLALKNTKLFLDEKCSDIESLIPASSYDRMT